MDRSKATNRPNQLRVILAIMVGTIKMSATMGKRDKRIDAYIAKSADFAKPILRELREIVHDGCPEVEETIKWGFPNFDYKGIMCGMAAFKQHCSFGFWKHSLITGKTAREPGEGMGSFGKLASMKDLPPRKVLIGYVKEAKRLNDDGIKVVRQKKPATKKELIAPDYMVKALKKNKSTWGHWEAFSPGKRKDYIEWVTEAKTEETRDRRLATTVEWVAEGKGRNWKYEKC